MTTMPDGPGDGQPDGQPGGPGEDDPGDGGGVAAKEPPATARGARTRAALVAAARTVFERDGFPASRLTDITAEARCSTGTFYTYFTSKDEIFQAVLAAAEDALLHPGLPHVAESEDPRALIESSNRAYFEAYRRNARLMMLQEQVAAIDADFRQQRVQRSEVAVHRDAQGIQRLQDAGRVDPELDPLITSRALSGMASRLAYGSFVLGRDLSVEDLVAGTTRLWINALGLGRAEI